MVPYAAVFSRSVLQKYNVAQIVYMFWHSIYKKCVALVGCLHCKVDYNRNSIVKLLYTYFRNSSFREHIGATIIHIGL